ncbi:MAG: hypothetical protein AVO38_01750 [delta proteobacterium ML8_D]|nr:MAG: hypothetical protein AVO38_01750 [delta proteobacterium ML8_D]
MIPGGIAGKLGNRYEAKWLVRSLLDVIADKAHWLNFESVETEYQGFEFAIGRGEITEWHQTKMNAPSGNWTIKELKKEGVLKAFSNRFSADENAHCFFVSQDNAKDFRTLTEKARTANSYVQYAEILSKVQKNDSFPQLKKEWRQSDEVVFNWLKRSYVEIIPERELDSLNESYGDLYFHEGGKSAFPNLREILENHFNKTLTGDAVRSAIKSQRLLKFKEWAFDPTIQQRLNDETEAYLQTYTPFGAGGETISRAQTATLIDEILKSDGPELVLLTGVAGSGKSGIVRRAIEQFRELNVPHLAFRVDQYLSCGTREELGKKLTGRKESPVSTLKGTFPTTPSILFIDQVDAVSEVSGRDGKVKEVIFRLITDAHNFGGVRIAVVCRTFDLDSDPRLKSLKKTNRTKQIDVPLLDWKADVEPLLKNKGVDLPSLNEPQRQLLRLPINLAVFLEIDAPDFLFHSLSNLHEKLIEKKQRTITKERKPPWSLVQPLTAMCDWMSQRQRLNAPISVLDAYPNAVDILTSEGMIISSRGQVNFFHESFFDHIYARAFVNHDQSLVDLLTATEQHLFRRTQVRQILEALRQNDFQRYLIELSSVLSSNDIRFHIKTAICQWLNSVEKPNEQEFEIISRFDDQSGKFHQFFRNAVLSTHAWFDLLNKKSWIRKQIDGDDKERAETMLWWLSNIAGQRPAKIASLLRSWWGSDTERAERLLNWFGFVRRGKPDDDLLQLCEDIIISKPNDLFKDQGRNRIVMLLHTWGEKSPKRCGRILHSLFEAWFALNPGRNLFERDELKAIDTHSLAKIAEKTPLTFLQGTTDAIVRSIDMVVADGKSGGSWYSFNHRTYSGQRFGFDEFLGMYRSALKKFIQEAPETATIYLKKLDPHKHKCLMHLHLEAIQANPTDFGNRLPTLVTNEMVFDAGWHGADWLSFAHACHEALPHLNSGEKKVVEQAILDHTPEIDLAIHALREINQMGETESFWTKESIIRNLNRSGYEQWCIFETIGEELLSPVAQSRLYELRRKFPKEKIAEPRHAEAHVVGSPIRQAQCDRMKDSHWLSAIKRYDTEEDGHRGRNFFDGGARELAGELQAATKKDPARFSDLSLRIPDTAHTSYIEHILWGLAEAEAPSDESLTQAVKRAHQHSDKPFGSDIARLLERHPHVAGDSEILEILIWYALNGEANENNEDSDEQNTERETIDINTLVQRGGCRGINGARGRAWEALGSVLWHVPKAEDRAWQAIEIAFKKEALISVRCCMMKSLEPLFNMNKELFSESIRRLIILPDGTPHQYDAPRLSPLITHTGVHIFPYIFHWLPELADELTSKLLESGDETKELIGAWLVFRESFRNDAYIDKANNLTSVSVDHRRLLADVAGDAIKWAENRHRAEALLKEFFFDEDEQVRRKAANAFRNVQAGEVELYRELAAVFLKSPAFPDNGFSALHMLEYATCDVLDLVIEATQQVITDITEKGDQHGRCGTDVYQLQDLLKREYTSSESNAEARKKILDLIDLMLSREIYGVDSIVTAHDRW